MKSAIDVTSMCPTCGKPPTIVSRPTVSVNAGPVIVRYACVFGHQWKRNETREEKLTYSAEAKAISDGGSL